MANVNKSRCGARIIVVCWKTPTFALLACHVLLHIIFTSSLAEHYPTLVYDVAWADPLDKLLSENGLRQVVMQLMCL